MSVVDVLQSGEALTKKVNGRQLFFWLKITGVPYYFFSAIDPSSTTRFGEAAWILPSGYTAVGGMHLPDYDLQQSLDDIIGGVASAERIRLTLTDFERFDSAGKYNVLSRLLSPGIATSTPGGYFELMSDIPTSLTTGGTVTVRRPGAAIPADGFYAVGGETIQITGWAPSGTGLVTGNVAGGRNRFPCSSVFPPIPYHRVVRNETNGAAIGKNILVTPYATPFTMIGRTAAFYIGAMDANGRTPLPESDGMLRLVGRISGYDFGDVSGGAGGGATYDLEITSITDDLDGALVAPGLGIARIKDDQILLPATAGTAGTHYNFLECDLTVRTTYGDQAIRRYHLVIDGSDVPDKRFTLLLLLRKFNDALSVLTPFEFNPNLRAGLTQGDDGQPHVVIAGASASVGNGPILNYFFESSGNSFLAALGFSNQPGGAVLLGLDEEIPIANSERSYMRAIAPRPAPNVFIPTTQGIFADPSRFSVLGQDGSTSQHFFLDQGDGRAFAQFGDGTVVNLENADTIDGSLKLTTGQRWRWSMGTTTLIDNDSPEPFYYVGIGEKATVRQVVLAGDRDKETDAGLFLGRFLASHDEASAIDDLNYYPDGVGLGWNQVLDRDSVRAVSSFGKSYSREIVVDSTTKLTDIMLPLLKAYGIGLVWDPEQSRVSLRPLRIPTAPGSHAIVLSEGNRAKVTDRSVQRIDAANVRTSYTLNWGWDMVEKKFTGVPITLLDNVVQSSGAYQKDEKIEDKTLWLDSDIDPIDYLNSLFFSRDYLYQQPWMRCQRTFNCAALTLAPGSYHQVVDNTMINPFTGRPGITAADGLYALILSVSGNPYNGAAGTVTFLINRTRKSGLFRSLSPCALLDYDAAGHGYNTGTGVVTLARRYSSHATNKDGWDSKVGDQARLIAWHSLETGPVYDHPCTVSAVAADGSTVTVTAGLPAIPDGTEVQLVLLDYFLSGDVRRAEVAYQGNETAMIVGGVADAENHRWG